MLGSVLRQQILTHAPDREWGRLGTVVDMGNGSAGLQMDGDPAPFPPGQWDWLMPMTLTRLSFDLATSTWRTQPGGGDGHTHALVLPDDLWQALRPPQIGDRVWVTWQDPDAQRPLVKGVVRHTLA